LDPVFAKAVECFSPDDQWQHLLSWVTIGMVVPLWKIPIALREILHFFFLIAKKLQNAKRFKVPKYKSAKSGTLLGLALDRGKR
jgi:hypothetical protein